LPFIVPFDKVSSRTPRNNGNATDKPTPKHKAIYTNGHFMQCLFDSNQTQTENTNAAKYISIVIAVVRLLVNAEAKNRLGVTLPPSTK